MEIVWVCLVGLVLGSFATVLVWRVPRGLSWVCSSDKTASDKTAEGKSGVRSECPHCHTLLSFPDLVPFFSWLFLRGRCRHCHVVISIRYPVIELLTVAGCLGVYMSWGFTAEAFIIMALIPFLAALLVIDVEHLILPDQLVILSGVPLLILVVYQYIALDSSFSFETLFWSKGGGGLIFAFVAWCTGFLMHFFLKKEALGFGDVKFFALAGLWLGLSWLPAFLIGAGVLGLFWGVGWRIIFKKQEFPFGPALILSLYAGIILQGQGIVAPGMLY